MPNYVPSIVIDQVIDAMKGFIQPFVGVDTPIIRGQENRVPPPLPAFVELTELFESDLETPAITNDPANQLYTISTPTKIDIQVDFYGANSGDWIKAVKAVYRTPYAVSQFPAGMAPLFCSDGHQIPLVTGEEQYEKRWALTASLQYNPDVIVPQQSATALTISTFEDLP